MLQLVCITLWDVDPRGKPMSLPVVMPGWRQDTKGRARLLRCLKQTSVKPVAEKESLP